jgi:hypothetical protein
MTQISEANKIAADELCIQIDKLEIWTNLRDKDIYKIAILCVEMQLEVLEKYSDEAIYYKQDYIEQIAYLKSLL